MKKLLSNKHGDMNMILSAIVMAIVFTIGIIVVFNVISGISGDLSDLDDEVATATGLTEGTDTYNDTNYATNATTDLISNVETFYTVGPIALIVVAAVGILSYVLLLRRT